MRWSAAASITGAAVLAVSAFALSPATGQGSNEGTVKINDTDADDFPANDPHVGCVFTVGFFGYPEDAEDVSVVFTVVPPTADSGQGDEIVNDSVPVAGDEAGGANDEDAVETYDLTSLLASYEAHPQQGYHIRLDVDSPETQGGPKSKVFWVVCEEPPPETTTTTEAPDGTTTTTKAPEGATTTTVPPDREAPPAPGAPEAPGAPGAPEAPGELPVTGSTTSVMTGVGVGLLLIGAALTLAQRRRLID